MVVINPFRNFGCGAEVPVAFIEIAKPFNEFVIIDSAVSIFPFFQTIGGCVFDSLTRQIVLVRAVNWEAVKCETEDFRDHTLRNIQGVLRHVRVAFMVPVHAVGIIVVVIFASWA